MSESKTKERNNVYDKLTPQRKMLVDMIQQNLESGAGLWKQGWCSGGVPENAITGKKYRGVNNMFLTYVSMLRGYSDNRWLTFNQMKDREWSFKTDGEGKSLGKNAGVSVEFFELWDRETKKKFDRSVLDGMSMDERQDYMDENVYPIRKYYTVFNGDLIDGIARLISLKFLADTLDYFIDPKNVKGRQTLPALCLIRIQVPIDRILLLFYLVHPLKDRLELPDLYSTSHH